MFFPIVLFIVMIVGFLPWQHILFNILMMCYLFVDEMRLAVVLYAVVLRIILWPLRIIGKRLENQKEELDDRVQQVQETPNPLEKKEKVQEIRQKYALIFNWTFFTFWFYLLNALATGGMFLSPFSAERIKDTLFSFVPMPATPIITEGFIPLVGVVDLAQQNTQLNFISALSVAVVGVLEVVMNKKNSKRDFIIYLLVFPVAAFFITNQVPSGFEFSIWMFESLTVLIILFERIGRRKKKV